MNSLNIQIDNLYTQLMTECESYPLPTHAKAWYTEELNKKSNPQDKLDALVSMLNDNYGMRDQHHTNPLPPHGVSGG